MKIYKIFACTLTETQKNVIIYMKMKLNMPLGKGKVNNE